MIPLPSELSHRYTTGLAHHGVAVAQQPHYRKWLRYYWDFCQKYGQAPTDRQSFPAFRAKLRSKRQSEAQCHQAEAAIALYYEPGRTAPATVPPPPAAGGATPGATTPGVGPEIRTSSLSSLARTDPARTRPAPAPQLPPREAEATAS